MTIYNEYETEPATAYSGSYVSKIFLPRTTIEDIGALRRVVIADGATRYISKKALVGNGSGKMYLMSDFPKITTIPDEFGWYIRGGYSKTVSIFSENERYHDTVLGHPIEYSKANGISGLINPNGFGFQDSRVHTRLDMAFLRLTSSINLFIGSAGTVVGRSDGDQEQFCDNVWNYTGPFQSRYKNVFRQREASIYLPFPASSVVSWSWGFGDSTRKSDPVKPVEYNAICYLCYTTRSAPSNEVPQDFSIMLDGPLAVAGPSNYIATFNAYTSEVGYVASYVSKDMLYTTYFGFGDDFANFPRGYFETFTTLNTRQLVLKYPPQIRGWKYGIFNGLPRNSSAVFRPGKYGQFRDMLEQRPFTKYYNGEVPLEGPVVVSFKSGTVAYSRAIDYVTATNPDYNLRDSGIYDYEYKCGYGFVDTGSV